MKKPIFLTGGTYLDKQCHCGDDPKCEKCGGCGFVLTTMGKDFKTFLKRHVFNYQPMAIVPMGGKNKD